MVLLVVVTAVAEVGRGTTAAGTATGVLVIGAEAIERARGPLLSIEACSYVSFTFLPTPSQQRPSRLLSAPRAD